MERVRIEETFQKGRSVGRQTSIMIRKEEVLYDANLVDNITDRHTCVHAHRFLVQAVDQARICHIDDLCTLSLGVYLVFAGSGGEAPFFEMDES